MVFQRPNGIKRISTHPSTAQDEEGMHAVIGGMGSRHWQQRGKIDLIQKTDPQK